MKQFKYKGYLLEKGEPLYRRGKHYRGSWTIKEKNGKPVPLRIRQSLFSSKEEFKEFINSVKEPPNSVKYFTEEE